MNPTPPPCSPHGAPANACARSLFDWLVHAVGDLPGPWRGWRLAGRYLVSPDRVRFTPERLRGLAWRQEAEQRLADARARREAAESQPVRIIVVELREFRRMQRGAA